MLHRCVYYKVPRERLARVCTAVRTVQRAWVTRTPGLQTELLLRVGEQAGADPATVMEVWRWEPAQATAAAAPPAWTELERQLGEAVEDALIGPRHVEDFGAAPG